MQPQDMAAIYGATLSTIVFLWNTIRYVREQRPQLHVDVYINKPVDTVSSNGEMCLKIVSVGKKPCLIEECGLTVVFLDCEKNLHIPSDKLPKTLNEVDRVEILYDDLPYEYHQVKYGWFRDSTGKLWKSKKWPLLTKELRHWYQRLVFKPIPNIKVDISTAEGNTDSVIIKVVNTGNVSMRIRGCGIQIGGKPPRTFPWSSMKLEPGQVYSFRPYRLDVPVYDVEYAFATSYQESHVWSSAGYPLSSAPVPITPKLTP